jgi:hypothetical protein
MLDLLAESSLRLRACASPFTKIYIGRSAELPDWLREGLVELSLRSEPLRDDEVVTLERSDIIKIACARERFRSEVMRVDQHWQWSQTIYGECLVPMTTISTAEQYGKRKFYPSPLGCLITIINFI